MKKIYFFLITLYQVFSLPVLAQLDNTFSGDGRASAVVGQISNGHNMLIQPLDQKIVVVGNYVDGAATGIALARFTSTGGLDPNFGTGGKVEISYGSEVATINPFCIGIQSNGSIVVAFELQEPDLSMFAILIRLTSTGKVDYGFSPAGYIKLATPYQVVSLLVQSDDKIVLGGYSGSQNGFVVERLTKDGALDAGYGQGGVFSCALETVEAMAFQSDGSIIATGVPWSGNFVQTIHLSILGKQDMSFGANGFSKLTVNTNDYLQIGAVTILGNNYILLTGSYTPATAHSQSRMLVVELDPGGNLNPFFAGNGKLGIPFPNYEAGGVGAVELYEGQIVAAASVSAVGGGPTQVGLARITANGAIDPGFGTNGLEITGWTNSSEYAEPSTIALQKDQKIVVGGNLGGSGLMAIRYLNPILLPPPPVVDAISPVQDNTLSSTEAAIRLYPNPASQTLNVQGLDPTTSTLLEVTDASGRIVLTTRSASAVLYSLEIGRLSAGHYFLSLATQTKRQTLSFVKTR
jgi:uncharacterized delta-60 repeat protein